MLAPWTSARPRAGNPFVAGDGRRSLRQTRAFLRDSTAQIDRGQVAADSTLMHHWLRHDHDMVAAYSLTEADVSPSAEATPSSSCGAR